MMWKLLVLSLAAVAIAGPVENEVDFEDLTRFGVYNELPCLSFGGICVQSGECPDGYRSSVQGLCPTQQKSGVECCHSLPSSEARCRSRGGECMSKSTRCPDKLTYNRATDCEEDEKCCILV